jgi:hypothetical protein
LQPGTGWQLPVRLPVPAPQLRTTRGGMCRQRVSPRLVLVSLY